MTDSRTPSRIATDARLKWVPLAEMVVNPKAQRELNGAWVAKIAAGFDPEQLGHPTLSLRNGKYFIVDGQHRVEATRRAMGPDQLMQCWVYEGLDEAGEANMFRRLNDQKQVTALSKFHVAVTAGWEKESEIDRIVRAQGCSVSKNKTSGAVSCVGTLHKVFDANGGIALGRALRLLMQGCGDAGMTAALIEGMGMVVGTYNGALDDLHMVRKLQEFPAGTVGLMNAANQTKLSTGHTIGQCVAATLVDAYNRGKQGRARLPQWWSNNAARRAS